MDDLKKEIKRKKKENECIGYYLNKKFKIDERITKRLNELSEKGEPV